LLAEHLNQEPQGRGSNAETKDSKKEVSAFGCREIADPAEGTSASIEPPLPHDKACNAS